MVRNEYRNEVREGTTIVGDCLVCRGTPSLDCLICKRKYSTNPKSADLVEDSVPKSSIITGFSDHYSRNSRVAAGGNGPTGTISSGPHSINSSKRSGNGNNSGSDNGSLHEHILALRHQIQAKDVKIELLQESLDESTKNVYYWKQQFQQLKLKLEDRDESDTHARNRHRDMEAQIKALKDENSMLLDRARVSEACRTNGAKELARLRAAHLHDGEPR